MTGKIKTITVPEAYILFVLILTFFGAVMTLITYMSMASQLQKPFTTVCIDEGWGIVLMLVLAICCVGLTIKSFSPTIVLYVSGGKIEALRTRDKVKVLDLGRRISHRSCSYELDLPVVFFLKPGRVAIYNTINKDGVPADFWEAYFNGGTLTISSGGRTLSADYAGDEKLDNEILLQLFIAVCSYANIAGYLESRANAQAQIRSVLTDISALVGLLRVLGFQGPSPEYLDNRLMHTYGKLSAVKHLLNPTSSFAAPTLSAEVMVVRDGWVEEYRKEREHDKAQ